MTYPPTYPDVAPEIGFETIDEDEEEETGELTEEETETVLGQLNTIVSGRQATQGNNRSFGTDHQVEDSLGMAMSFTLVTSCREALSGVVSTRLIREQEAEDRKAREYEEVSL